MFISHAYTAQFKRGFYIGISSTLNPSDLVILDGIYRIGRRLPKSFVAYSLGATWPCSFW